jgi:FMN phosphatase YigB (HAD superfamily)
VRPAESDNYACTLAELPRYVESRSGQIRVVSFDVFDTLLTRVWSQRRVRLEAVRGFRERLWDEPLDRPSVEVVLEHRCAFERAAESVTRNSRGEWGVRDWAAAVTEQWDVSLERALSAADHGQLAAEQRGTCVAAGARDALSRLGAIGMRCVASSDTYLSESALRGLLEHHELRLDEVFSSSTIGRSKRRGGFYLRVAERLGEPPHALLHVGDNLKSDAIRAAEAGCAFVWMPSLDPTPGAPPWFGGDRKASRTEVGAIARALSARAGCTEQHALYRFGYGRVAELLAAFSIWQWRTFRDHGVDDVLYVAREGRRLLAARELLDDALPDGPRRHYVRLSRRAVTLALDEDWLAGDGTMPGKVSGASADAFLNSFDLPTTLRDKVLLSAQLAPDARLDAAARARLNAALRTHRAEIDSLRGRRSDDLRAYLEQVVGRGDLGTLGIVDSGWAGTTQQAVAAVLGSDERVVGAYVGVSDQGPEPTRVSQKMGLIRDDYRGGLAIPALRAAGVIRAVELTLSDPREPTTLGLRRDEHGAIEPVLDERRDLPASRAAAVDALEAGIEAGVAARLDGVRCLAEQEALSLASLETYARLQARRAYCCPPRDAAAALLDFEFDEGAVRGKTSTLGLAGLRDSVAWLPGIFAKYRLGALQPVLDAATTLYDRLQNGHIHGSG